MARQVTTLYHHNFFCRVCRKSSQSPPWNYLSSSQNIPSAACYLWTPSGIRLRSHCLPSQLIWYLTKEFSNVFHSPENTNLAATILPILYNGLKQFNKVLMHYHKLWHREVVWSTTRNRQCSGFVAISKLPFTGSALLPCLRSDMIFAYYLQRIIFTRDWPWGFITSLQTKCCNTTVMPFL